MQAKRWRIVIGIWHSSCWTVHMDAHIPPAETRVPSLLFPGRLDEGDPEAHREYTRYLAKHMGPMVHALMLVAVFAYLAATGASAIASASLVPLSWRLTPALPLLLVALGSSRVQAPLPLSLLALVCVLLLEIGINLNGFGRPNGMPWVLPGCLLVPVASSVIWPGRWDFIAAMTLCALGPLPMLLLGADVNGNPRIFQYAVYMVIAICVSVVLRAFMTRTLFEQFRLERQLRAQANTDDLTGLLLRNRFLELARLKLAEAQRQRQPVCMLYLDADHFKQLNDDYGHAAGDTALIALAFALRSQTRKKDLIGRIGGEEFALLLPGLDAGQAAERAERLRLATHAVQRPDGPLTVSIGIAQCDHYNEDIEDLLARADQAMRQAKRSGRDQVVRVDA
jgi:diguanylate cyclase (GGDEF)-like protein